MKSTCEQCLKPCPEHGITFCGTCHKHEGECHFGDCQSPATHLVQSPLEGRRFCKFHANSPMFQFARAGASVSLLEKIR